MQTDVTITNIFWKRTYLFIEYESQKQEILSIVKLKKIRKNDKAIINEHVLETKEIGENKYRAKINITIAEGRKILEQGTWKIQDNRLY